MTNLNLKYFKTLSLSELGLWLLIPFASLTSHTWLPLPPTVVLLLGAVACWIIQQIYDEKNQKSELGEGLEDMPVQGIILFGMFSVYLFMSQYLIDAAFRHYLGAMLAPLYLVLILIFSKHTSTDFVKKSGQKFIRYSLVILCIEAILRYSTNIWYILKSSNSYIGIYSFKFNGPMYTTSNAVAAHLVVLLFFMLWWSRTHKQSMKKELCVAFVLIALTFSRASLVAVAGGLIYYRFFRHLNWKKALLFLSSFCILAFFGIWMLKSLYDDFSFQSKFTILNESLEYFKTASLKNILFGIGFDESAHIMTFHAHNYFLLFLLESGVIGFLFLCTTLFFLIKSTNGRAMIVLFPFLIQTSTESNTFLPYFYVAMGLMLIFAYKGVCDTPQRVPLKES